MVFLMKKLRKVFALVLAGFVLVVAAACNGSNEVSSESAAPAASTPAASGAGSKGFPNGTITLLCPFSAGGGTDLGARHLATALSKQLGVNVVVENLTGSGGWIAWTNLITGDYDDGYTIGLINHNYAMGVLDPENPREYDLDDVQVIINQVIDDGLVAIRSSETRFTDLESLIEYGKNNDLLIASNAVGITDGDSTTAEWFNQNFDMRITTVPVSGSSDARSMFMSGDVDIFFASVSDVANYVANGEMKALCVFNEERSEYLPDVPTISEATGKSLRSFACRGYFYPNSVSPEIVSFMTEAMKTAMQDETYISDMESLGLKLDDTSGEAYKELLQSQVDVRISVWG